ncbi:hypothetical protein ES703_27194 [subsurface metagenome]
MNTRNEVCYVLVGKQLGRLFLGKLVKKSVGSPSLVEFDWEWVLKREEKKEDVLGFWHTHPHGAEPSERDIKTMRAWVSCFNKPLFCVIQANHRRDVSILRFWISNDSDRGMISFSASKFFRFFDHFLAIWSLYGTFPP